MNSTLIAPTRARPAAQLPQHVLHQNSSGLDADDPAYCAMTDFLKDCPITVPADYLIEAALDDMNRLGVHSLLVTCDEPASQDARFVGLVSSYEIQRVRAHRQASPPASHASQKVRVGDVMTAWDELSVVRHESLREMTAYDLYQMFQGTGLTHLLVIDDHGGDTAIARGLISRARLASRLRLTPSQSHSGSLGC